MRLAKGIVVALWSLLRGGVRTRYEDTRTEIKLAAEDRTNMVRLHPGGTRYYRAVCTVTPNYLSEIKNELIQILKNKGFKNVSEAIGTKN